MAGHDVIQGLKQPTLFLVGGLDAAVLHLNEQALRSMSKRDGEKRLTVVAEASHLFEEKGTLEEVAALASDWFAAHLTGSNELRPSASSTTAVMIRTQVSSERPELTS